MYVFGLPCSVIDHYTMEFTVTDAISDGSRIGEQQGGPSQVDFHREKGEEDLLH